MAQIQWNLLNTNAPTQIAASFDPVGAYDKLQQARTLRAQNEAVQQKMQQAAKDEEDYRNALAQQGTSPGQMKAQTDQRTFTMGELDKAKKFHDVVQQASARVAAAPKGRVLESAMQHTAVLHKIMGTSQEQYLSDIQALQNDFATGGEELIRQNARQLALDTEKTLSDMQMVDLGRTKRMVEMNPDAPGYQGKQEFQVGMSPAQAAQASQNQQNISLRGQELAQRKHEFEQKALQADPDLNDFSQEEIDVWGKFLNTTGKMPSLGRSKGASVLRMAIAKSASRQALGMPTNIETDVASTKTPTEAALDMLGEQSDTKSIQGSLNFLDKQVGSMGSFVTNLGLQVDKIKELSKDLKTYDTRLLNLPLRAIRGKIQGSPLQAKYDMYLAEIESEIGKLATGSSASIAELSTSAQDKWAAIHDKNLSVGDMLQLLDETRKAADMRLESVEAQLQKTRKRMRREVEAPKVVSDGTPVLVNAKGWKLMIDSAGNKAYVNPTDSTQFEEVK